MDARPVQAADTTLLQDRHLCRPVYTAQKENIKIRLVNLLAATVGLDITLTRLEEQAAKLVAQGNIKVSKGNLLVIIVQKENTTPLLVQNIARIAALVITRISTRRQVVKYVVKVNIRIRIRKRVLAHAIIAKQVNIKTRLVSHRVNHVGRNGILTLGRNRQTEPQKRRVVICIAIVILRTLVCTRVRCGTVLTT